MLTPCFINGLIERVFCVVCPTLPPFFEYLCAVLGRFTCLMLWGFVFLRTVSCCVCLFLLQFLTGTLPLLPYQSGFFFSVLYVTWWMWINQVTCLYGFILKMLPFNHRVWIIYVCNTTVKDLCRFPWCLSYSDCSNLQCGALRVASVWGTVCGFFLCEAQSGFAGAYNAPVPAEVGGDIAGPGYTRLVL